jgi:hypothetical protein
VLKAFELGVKLSGLQSCWGQIFNHLSKTLMPFSVAAGSWDCSFGSKLDPLIAALENEYP